jgi:predicted transcriptional regulator
VKTTVELPDDLLRSAQETARREGTTVKSLMEEGLRLALARHLDTTALGLRDASVGGNGLRPEYQGASWADIRRAAYGDRL